MCFCFNVMVQRVERDNSEIHSLLKGREGYNLGRS